MIAAGIILLLIAYLLPDVLPNVPPGILHICSVLGWVALIIGIILLLLGLVLHRPIAGRRYWY